MMDVTSQEVSEKNDISSSSSRNKKEKYSYSFVKYDKWQIIILKGDMPIEVPQDFIDAMSAILLRPTHVLINCFCTKRLTYHWLNMFSSMHFLLQNLHKRIGLVYLSPSIKVMIQNLNLKSLKTYEGVRSFLADLQPTDEEIPFNFIKAYIYSTVDFLFVRCKTPSYRKKIYTKEKIAEKFLGDVNATTLVTAENFFYSITLSFPHSTFMRMNEVIEDENIFSASSALGLEETIKKLSDLIAAQAERVFNLKNSPYELSQKDYYVDQNIPEAKINFKGKEWSQFLQNPSVVVEFSSMKGDYFMEITFPKEFQLMVLKAIK